MIYCLIPRFIRRWVHRRIDVCPTPASQTLSRVYPSPESIPLRMPSTRETGKIIQAIPKILLAYFGLPITPHRDFWRGLRLIGCARVSEYCYATGSLPSFGADTRVSCVVVNEHVVATIVKQNRLYRRGNYRGPRRATFRMEPLYIHIIPSTRARMH
ncbi:hypothetical protein GYMLUDRAFT_828498 [Collybiopsis luxurians FD-317 M1]|uniref:Uncharacterized protein n=1 Tax=Collybiopsis luxurians FD-317 M1 TaxID=944289 RepID=A0A0D0CD35_9AGAR|nr:hypothetical protein GYMLUDRAFT_828498 [Collybiopsis luxurians FD-317 M1]